MRLSEALEYKGLFWRDPSGRPRIGGTLRIAESGKATLDLVEESGGLRQALDAWEKLGNSHSDEPDARWWGMLATGEFVTLDECRPVQLTFNALNLSRLSVGKIYIGHHYPVGSAITYSKLTCSVEGLDQWFSHSPIRIQHDNDGGLNICYTNLAEIAVDLPGKLTLSFGQNLDAKDIAIPIVNVSLTVRSYMALESESPRDLDELLHVMLVLIKFLCFALDVPLSLTSVRGFSPDVKRDFGDGEPVMVPVAIYAQTWPFLDHSAEISERRKLFTYSDVKDRLNEALCNWVEYYRGAQPVIDLFLACQGELGPYVETRFLSMTRSLEVMHRRQSHDTDIPADEFAHLLDSIVAACPEAKRKWLREKLKYVNELSLRKRLRALLIPFEECFGTDHDRRRFVNGVVRDRNLLTHYDEESNIETRSLQSLDSLSEKLKVLCQMHLLCVIGFSQDEVRDLSRSRESLKRRLSA